MGTETKADTRPRWLRRLDHPWLIGLDWLGDNTVGSHSVPSSWRMGDIRAGGSSANRKIDIRTDNDAFGIMGWTYYDDMRPEDEPSVAFSLNRSEAHQLAWWILRWWAAEWFGLRRWLYYKVLHREIASWHRR